MKTIIVYYSHSGNNKVLAQALQARLSCEVISITEVSKRSWFARMVDLVFNRMPAICYDAPELERYDLVICAAPIWVGKIASPLMSFLRKERDHIKTFTFITLCGGVSGQKEKIEEQLQALVGKGPKCVSELWISSLLNGKQSASGYRVQPSDLVFFEVEIARFLLNNNTETKRVSPTADSSC